jgi:diaminohydroxyphosphoribosylaminopyrimidine deaminase/5-amino-6-(5-phosphoribosylamino)uracil reductase
MDVSGFSANDIKFMKMAIRLGRKGTGYTEPNPLVGAVVVKGNDIIATGYHRLYGGLHAEREALQHVDAEGATLYVPLEPCSHHGKQPPCVDIVIEKKIARVVMATQDPCSLVDGKGIERLREAGVQVDVGCLGDLYKFENRHYFKYIQTNRPYITLRAGVSIDGKLTDKNRNSQWVTDEGLRRISRSFRGEFSAIMAGSGTILDDNPQLTLRGDWEGKRLYRVVLDSGNRLPQNLKIFEDQEHFPLVIFSSKEAENKDKKCRHHHFVSSIPNSGGLDLEEVLDSLGKLGIASVLVEGGGRLIDSFLQSGLFDEIILFTADKLLGGGDSVQLAAGGFPLPAAIQLENREVTPLENGYIVRSVKLDTPGRLA